MSREHLDYLFFNKGFDWEAFRVVQFRFYRHLITKVKTSRKRVTRQRLREICGITEGA